MDDPVKLDSLDPDHIIGPVPIGGHVGDSKVSLVTAI
jgi:hypothetical protein